MQKITLLISFIFLVASVSYANEVACKENAGKAALVIIDMQPYFVNRAGLMNIPENKAKFDKVTSEQVKAIKKAIEYKTPIILIEYTNPYVMLGETNETLQAAVKNYKNVKVIKKTTDGMFDRRNLHREELVKHLQDNNIGTLVITGANGGACVLQSIVGSLDANCSVVAYGGAIADFNFQEFIFPYVGQYNNIVKPNCVDCSFKEVAHFNEAEGALARGSGSGAAPNRANGGYR